MGSVISTRREKGKNYLLQTLDEHIAGINCMVLSDDGSVLCTGSDDYSIRLWSAKTDPVECIGFLTGHHDYVTHIIIEENILISASVTFRLKVIQKHPNSLYFELNSSPTHTLILADKTLRKWEMSSCQCLHVFAGHTSLISRVLCTGNFIFSTSYDRTMRCWDIDSGVCIRVFRGHKHGVSPIIFIPSVHDASDSLEELDMYAKDVIITGSQDATAKSWSFTSDECLKTFKGHTAGISCLAIDQQEKLLFTGAADNTIRCWNIFHAHELRIFEAHSASIISIVVIYTGCGDSLIRCFDARSGILKRVFKSHTLGVSAMRVTQERLFTASADGTLKIWDIADLQPGTIETTQLTRNTNARKLDSNLEINSLQERSLNNDKRSNVDSEVDERKFHDQTHDIV
ncbi:unnamed protein product [Didymodactylos carnosus]|uniref:WD repeat-containing protein 86 n=1 Tax=Didymodactylos carnosus TaxID=1234261 RepID=A0A814S1C3_9BILA|nr:unnamed protein product [Didymodactylos carnosus]CAF1140122.1 unnamed protein product [Didymodactylos carnosus]CAF3515394.1 unnamed protein product [Didymodactylos carnosus]CAF3903823.1 unnamed protein product [Didymodactylos carnosus]